MKPILCLWISFLGFCHTGAFAADAPARPNILWVTCEDINPHLGCYGDTYATTPNLDRLAAKGVRYVNAWSCAPVCAPARTTIISGLYPPSTGAEHMRSLVKLPPGMKMVPQLLREAGYYCTNNSKEDYNLEKPGQVWDESSNKAHWKNRKEGQPFFAVFNILISHESQIRKRPHLLVHDPAKVKLPAYHPDTPEVRHDWAQYYDNITTMDKQIGERLKELADADLVDDTIVVYFADHGSGMPRSKRSACNSGLQVPLIVSIPEKYRGLAPKDYASGGKSERLVSFIDLAPTMLSLIDKPAPAEYQGRAFLGARTQAPPEFLHGFRGRMDERYDLVRSVRDARYVYIRNYMPHKIPGQHVAYMFETPTTRVWKKLYDEGKLTPEQKHFWEPKPPEELYDLQTDPDEVHNLASAPTHQDILKRLRHAQQEQVVRIRDVGFLPEDEMHSRSKGASPYEVGHDDSRYPLHRIVATAELAASGKRDGLAELKAALQDRDSAVRYWAVLGLRMHGREAVQSAHADLAKAMTDTAPSVRIAAAEAIGKYGEAAEVKKAVAVLLELAPLSKNGPYVSMEALNALDELHDKAVGSLDILKDAVKGEAKLSDRLRGNLTKLVQKIGVDVPKEP